ncbi:hypothetical protein RHMOL_Rhmol07G0208000 [Rhododendron molle]|uniref:Uncharacterized protein n=1 Tax=Rhododendron molle TaxID=49168 RepID=A0ACC0N2P6_RHOML|nr:hypothetical protein RHMOL_Rhmol07G0208000 [Rhododendron molle]
MDPNWRFTRRLEKGESSGSGSRTRARGQAPPPVQHRNIRPSFGSAEDEELHRLMHTRTMRVLTTNGEVVERPIDEYGGLSIEVPTHQYDATEDAYFKLDWNQSSFEGEAADLLKWPNMFVQRNKLEAKCHKYLLKVPKARSAQMMDGRRPNRLHNDVCERLQVEINAMCRRVIRQGLIVKKVREAERDDFDPRESIRGIRRDPQYASDPEVSDYSDNC